MKHRALAVVPALVWMLAAGMAAATLTVQGVVDQVSQTTYTHYLDDVLYTHLGDNRGLGGPDHDPARANIFNHFIALGLDTSLHGFAYGGETYYNVVGIHTGTTRPGDIYMVGAHYDTVGTPGADDDASGTAGVMEAARVLSGYDFEATLVFIAFDREEQGERGSTAYAQDHSGDDILGMVSLDDVAHNLLGQNAADIYGRAASDPVKHALADAMALYGGITTTINGQLDSSDHAPFEWQGFQACWLLEEWGNPYAHTADDSVDTVGYIDYAYATNMVRGTVGYLATAAVLVPEPGVVVLVVVGAVALLRRRF